jgi:hypothetical protein
VAGNALNLRWPSNYTGWLLQSNSVSLAISNNWFTIPAATTTNQLQVKIGPDKQNVFYRLIPP